MTRDHPHWAGAFSALVENMIIFDGEYDRFRAEQLLQQYRDGYEVPDYSEISHRWDALQEAENND